MRETNLPYEESFYRTLTASDIENEDYDHDNNFRKPCLFTYNLDAAHNYTAPRLSFDAMIKMTIGGNSTIPMKKHLIWNLKILPFKYGEASTESLPFGYFGRVDTYSIINDDKKIDDEFGIFS